MLLDEVLTDIETAGPDSAEEEMDWIWALLGGDELFKDQGESTVDALKASHFGYTLDQWMSTGHNRALLTLCIKPEGLENLGLRDTSIWVYPSNRLLYILQNGSNGYVMIGWQPGKATAGVRWRDGCSFTDEALLNSLRTSADASPVHVEADELADAWETYFQNFGEGLSVGEVTFEISADKQSIYINRPAIGGSGHYSIAYNIYDSDSQPVNYFYSDEKRVAATPGYGGLFNVFVTVTDLESGYSLTRNIGWQTLLWPQADSLTVGKVTFERSPDGCSVFINRPAIACKGGSVTIAYNIYDAKSNPVNYFYSARSRVAATPGYRGRFNVFIVVTDTVTGEVNTQDIGWGDLDGDGPVPPEPTAPPTDPDDPYAPENVRARMLALQDEYYEGRSWTNSDFYAWNGGIYTGGYGCVAFAFILSDAAFGNLRARRYYEFTYDELRVGDILRINGNTHTVIILEKHDDHVVIAEGNYNYSIHWGRKLTREKVMTADYILTRYPE